MRAELASKVASSTHRAAESSGDEDGSETARFPGVLLAPVHKSAVVDVNSQPAPAPNELEIMAQEAKAQELTAQVISLQRQLETINQMCAGLGCADGEPGGDSGVGVGDSFDGADQSAAEAAVKRLVYELQSQSTQRVAMERRLKDSENARRAAEDLTAKQRQELVTLKSIERESQSNAADARATAIIELQQLRDEDLK
eukprot:SAG31_NODE_9420_length_1280_cov_1.011854_2_plen_198_part_01